MQRQLSGSKYRIVDHISKEINECLSILIDQRMLGVQVFLLRVPGIFILVVAMYSVPMKVVRPLTWAWNVPGESKRAEPSSSDRTTMTF